MGHILRSAPCPSPYPRLCTDLPHHYQTVAFDHQSPPPSALWPSVTNKHQTGAGGYSSKDLGYKSERNTSLTTENWTENLHWWDESVCWKASVCYKQCLRWRPNLHPPPRRLCPEGAMGYGPSQETLFQLVMTIWRSPHPQHHQLYHLEKERDG